MIVTIIIIIIIIIIKGKRRAYTWREEKPEGVVESENFKILRDFTVRCDRKIEAGRQEGERGCHN